MRKYLAFLVFTISFLYAQTGELTTYQIEGLPVEFSYLKDEAQVAKDGSRSYTVVARGGEEYYINLFNASSRFNADSLRYLFTGIYSSDPSVENIQVNEVGSGTMGELPAERVRITFMYDGSFFTATCVLVRFHLNHRTTSFLLYYEMADRNMNNAIRYDAVQKGFEDLCGSFKYLDFKYAKHEFPYEEDKATIEYPDFWFVENNDTAALIDDGRCKISITPHVAEDSTTTSTYAKCQKDAMKKNSALYPSCKSRMSTVNWQNDELATLLKGTYQIEVFGARLDWYYEKYFIRRELEGKMIDFHVLFECPDMYMDYYRPKFDIIFKSLVLPGKAAEVKKK